MKQQYKLLYLLALPAALFLISLTTNHFFISDEYLNTIKLRDTFDAKLFLESPDGHNDEEEIQSGNTVMDFITSFDFSDIESGVVYTYNSATGGLEAMDPDGDLDVFTSADYEVHGSGADWIKNYQEDVPGQIEYKIESLKPGESNVVDISNYHVKSEGLTVKREDHKDSGKNSHTILSNPVNGEFQTMTNVNESDGWRTFYVTGDIDGPDSSNNGNLSTALSGDLDDLIITGSGGSSGVDLVGDDGKGWFDIPECNGNATCENTPVEVKMLNNLARKLGIMTYERIEMMFKRMSYTITVHQIALEFTENNQIVIEHRYNMLKLLNYAIGVFELSTENRGDFTAQYEESNLKNTKWRLEEMLDILYPELELGASKEEHKKQFDQMIKSLDLKGYNDIAKYYAKVFEDLDKFTDHDLYDLHKTVRNTQVMPSHKQGFNVHFPEADPYMNLNAVSSWGFSDFSDLGSYTVLSNLPEDLKDDRTQDRIDVLEERLGIDPDDNDSEICSSEASCDQEFEEFIQEILNNPPPAGANKFVYVDYEKKIAEALEFSEDDDALAIAESFKTAVAKEAFLSSLEHHEITSSGKTILEIGKPVLLKFEQLSDSEKLEVAQEAAETTTIADNAENSFWPQNAEEWEAILYVMGPLFLEVAISFIPGSDVIDLFRSLESGDKVGVALAVGGLVVSAVGGSTIKGAIKGAKVYQKATKIATKLGGAIVSAGQAAKKGFKTAIDTAGNLVIKKGDEVIAAGDDVVKRFLTRSDWKDNLVTQYGDDITQFVTRGLDPSDIPTSVKNDLLNASNAPSNLKEGIVNDLIKAGSTSPVKAGVSQGDELVKIVPSGESVSDFSPYWTTKAELNDLRATAGSLEQKLGLPIGSHSPKYDVFEIKATQSSDVFTSNVASTVQNGYETTGGAVQTLVLDRSKWSNPVKIDSFIP